MKPDEAKVIIELLRDTVAIQKELLKRSEYQVEQLKKEINNLKEGLNIIDPHGVLRSECV